MIALPYSSQAIEPRPQLPEATTPKVAGSHDGTNAVQRIPSELASPWTTAARPWLLWGTGMTVGFLALQKYDDENQQRMAKEKPLGTLSVIGDYAGRLIPNALYVAGMYGAYWNTKDEDYKKNGQIMFKASAYSAGVSTILKLVVREQRPNNGKDRSSFPSGHATTAFAFSGVVIAEHGFWPYGLGATALATLTAVSRMNDNMHHGHDVVAGATIGTAFGLGVSYINQALDKKESKTSFMPFIDKEFNGLQVVRTFQ